MFITKNGLEQLRKKIKELEQEEKDALEAVIVARGYGDFSENSELEAARSQLERAQAEKANLNSILAESEVFSISRAQMDVVGFGALVKLEDEAGKIVEYKIVGESEVDLKQGKLPINSPLAKAILGKKIEDECFVTVPNGEKCYYILSIDYSWLKD